MGIKNYLIDGMSGTGKTTVAEELKRRGYHVIHGDRVLAYQGNPKTGKPLDTPAFENVMDKINWEFKHWIWDTAKVTSMIADHSNAISFFCGSSRNFSYFIDALDGVFILEIDDLGTLYKRIDERVARDPTDWGGEPGQKELLERLHTTKEDIPEEGVVIDASMPLKRVVDTILKHVTDTV